MKFGKLFIISAPSGAGKTSLVKAVLEQIGSVYNLHRAVTTTTRPIRAGEVDGVDYHFISVDEFKEKINQDAFLEWSTWYDHYYGSPVSLLKKIEMGQSFLMVLDRAGAKDVKQLYPAAVLIWITPPSLNELKKRLITRGDAESSIENRIQKAKIELEEEKKEHLYQYHIINDDFKKAVESLKTLVKNELKTSSKC